MCTCTCMRQKQTRCKTTVNAAANRDETSAVQHKSNQYATSLTLSHKDCHGNKSHILLLNTSQPCSMRSSSPGWMSTMRINASKSCNVCLGPEGLQLHLLQACCIYLYESPACDSFSATRKGNNAASVPQSKHGRWLQQFIVSQNTQVQLCRCWASFCCLQKGFTLYIAAVQAALEARHTC